MIEWIWLLVPVVAVVLLIVGGLMRGMAQAQEEEQRKEREREKRPRPVPPPRPTAAPRPAGGGTELDRFLQEVQRRKRGGEAKPAEPVPVAAPRPAPQPRPAPPPRAKEPPPVPKPRPRPRAEEPPAPRSRPRRDGKPVPVVEEVVTVEVVEEERKGPAWQPQTVDPTAPGTAEQAYKTAAANLGRPTSVDSTILVQLRELLKTRQSMRAAVMLSEVVGPPRCKRR